MKRALALVLLAVPTVAQSEVDRRPPDPTAVPETGETFEGPLQPTDLTKAGVLAAATVPSGVRRERLDPATEAELSYAEVPGGVVFGRAATPVDGANVLEEARIAFDAEQGLSLELADGRTFRLPAADATYLRGALAFADPQASGDWLVDIGANGEVQLAPELVDTAAGVEAVRADLVPNFFVQIR